MTEIEEKIENITYRMTSMKKDTHEYGEYMKILKELEAIRDKVEPVLKVHNTPEVCESCQ